MANNPKKTIDPTEAALSAIQQALNIRDDEDQGGAAPQQTQEVPGADPAAKAAPRAPRHDLFDDDPIGTRDLGIQAPAANDDQQSIGQVLQALQRRPARTSYMVAAA